MLQIKPRQMTIIYTNDQNQQVVLNSVDSIIFLKDGKLLHIDMEKFTQVIMVPTEKILKIRN